MKKAQILIGNTIRQFREKQGISLQIVSERSGINIETLTGIEDNQITGTLESLDRIAAALGFKLSDLIQAGKRINEAVREEFKKNIRDAKYARILVDFVRSEKDARYLFNELNIELKYKPVFFRCSDEDKDKHTAIYPLFCDYVNHSALPVGEHNYCIEYEAENLMGFSAKHARFYFKLKEFIGCVYNDKFFELHFKNHASVRLTYNSDTPLSIDLNAAAPENLDELDFGRAP
ncbi:MAG: helix-turn-helix transcriptional regulator [Candidatus Omnitrophica bacterium]|nr:helix-turn-helix transcriptional regulator [Candidatus Omnitrophota bacterium]HOX54831.1 helix-turn-helix transcriptional regulator [Candidatus Omnitrophota bacterium]